MDSAMRTAIIRNSVESCLCSLLPGLRPLVLTGCGWLSLDRITDIIGLIFNTRWGSIHSKPVVAVMKRFSAPSGVVSPFTKGDFVWPSLQEMTIRLWAMVDTCCKRLFPDEENNGSTASGANSSSRMGARPEFSPTSCTSADSCIGLTDAACRRKACIIGDADGIAMLMITTRNVPDSAVLTTLLLKPPHCN